MKMLFAYDYPESGTWSVLHAMAPHLEAMGHEIVEMPVGKDGRLIPNGFDRSLADFDAAHFWNLRSFEPFAKSITIPYGFTCHGNGGVGEVHLQMEQYYISKFKEANPHWMHAMDLFSISSLGRADIFAFYTPQVMTPDGLTRYPKPEKMSIGSIGSDDDGFRRHALIRQAAQLMEVPCVLNNTSRTCVSRRALLDKFKEMAVYVEASFGMTGPIPPQEALLQGRPILTTRITTMTEIMKEGVNGEFFDGSLKDLVRQATKIFDNYDHYYEGTKQTVLNSPKDAAERFIAGIEANMP